MHHSYAPIPITRNDDDRGHDELDAAFGSDGEDDNGDESQPFNPAVIDHPLRQPPPQPQRRHSTYDFENADYDYPPPGSPPRPSERALPNDIGNSNGLLPAPAAASRPHTHRTWLARTAEGLLPARLVHLVRPPVPVGAVGGGILNDGVFANVTAKPSRHVPLGDGDDALLVPEDARADAPPSYASAQADAVPPYWETVVHAPFAPDALGEMIIDSLPTGSLFSFLWNALVSVSFQFVGFLLTYLLHTTHAARFGSRAGLGVTLIQYGFALRTRESALETDAGVTTGPTWAPGWSPSQEAGPAKPSFATANEAADYYNSLNANGTLPPPPLPMPEDEARIFLAESTTDWLSFFLMTVGWFILLTSLLGFWRVKRWERGIVSAQQQQQRQDDPSASGASPARGPARQRALSILTRFSGALPLSLNRARRSLSLSFFPGAAAASPTEIRARREEEDGGAGEGTGEDDPMLARVEEGRVPRAPETPFEQRLRDDLHRAGFL